MGRRGYLAVAALMAMWPLLGLSQDLEILYAEPIELTLPDVGTSGRLQKTSSWRTSFHAYGRRLEMDLASNAELLSRLPESRRQSFTRLEFYRGKLASRPDTWVRLTRTPTGIYGALWDGTELLAIAPAHYVQRFMASSLQHDGTQPFVYRLSDTVSVLSSAYCAADGSLAPQQSSAGTTYRRLAEELRARKITPGETGLLEVALVGDSQFVNAHADPEEAMLSRINIVDGIFTDQLGVAIRPTHVETTTAAQQPFTSNQAETLLDQFAGYRESSATLRARGLAHLFTGRDLNGDTAGIAYIDALCEPRIGASLSQGWLDVFTSALVVAHELGHNFGAPHDGVPGACSTTAPNYLMSAYLNGSSTFSQCSIDQMRPRAEEAQCVVPAGDPDLSVATTPTEVQGTRNLYFQIPVEVTSPGEFTARNAQLQITLPEPLRLHHSSSTSWCSFAGNVATCPIGDVGPGQSRSYVFEATSNTVGEFEGVARITSTNDRNAANDSQTIRISVIDASDATIAFDEDSYSLVFGDSLEIGLTVQTTGTAPLGFTTVRIDLPGIQVASVSALGASCTIEPVVVTCTYPSLSVPSSHHVLVSGIAQLAGNRYLHAEVTSVDDGDRYNDDAFAPLTVQSLTDVAVSMSPAELLAVVDAQVEAVVAIESQGLETIDGVVLTIRSDMETTFDEAVPSQGSCDVGATIRCDIGTMPSGQSATITVRMRAPRAGTARLSASVASASDQMADNDSAYAILNSRRMSDVYVGGSDYFAGFDTVPLTFSAWVMSAGFQSADDVTVTATVPETIVIETATMDGFTCSVTDHVATCERTSMASGAVESLYVTVLPGEPGLFTATVTATATTDEDPANDTRAVTLEINAYVDTRTEVEMPTGVVQMHQPFSIPVTLFQNRHRATDVHVQVWWHGPGGMSVTAPSIDGATCTQAQGSVTCVIDRLEAESRTDLVFSAIALGRGTFYWNIGASSSADRNWANDSAFGSVMADREGDAAVEVASSSVSGVAGTSFEYPDITVRAVSGVDEVILEFELPTGAGVSLSWLTDGSRTCYANGNLARCHLDSLESGDTRTFRAWLYGSAEGTVNAKARVLAANDIDAGNDVAYVTIRVLPPPAEPPPPPPPPPTSGGGNSGGSAGGGGGGGGSSSVPLLLLLAALSLVRDRRRACI